MKQELQYQNDYERQERLEATRQMLDWYDKLAEKYGERNAKTALQNAAEEVESR